MRQRGLGIRLLDCLDSVWVSFSISNVGVHLSVYFGICFPGCLNFYVAGCLSVHLGAFLCANLGVRLGIGLVFGLGLSRFGVPI